MNETILAYSIQPALVIQSKASASDLQAANGSRWRGLLADSTLERIQIHEGTLELDKVVEHDENDLAGLFRCH